MVQSLEYYSAGGNLYLLNRLFFIKVLLIYSLVKVSYEQHYGYYIPPIIS